MLHYFVLQEISGQPFADSTHQQLEFLHTRVHANGGEVWRVVVQISGDAWSRVSGSITREHNVHMTPRPLLYICACFLFAVNIQRQTEIRFP